ncbi:hypothetical protein NAPIS_ORF00575, partial [Vairimorpha apis BRL 01]
KLLHSFVNNSFNKEDLFKAINLYRQRINSFKVKISSIINKYKDINYECEWLKGFECGENEDEFYKRCVKCVSYEENRNGGYEENDDICILNGNGSYKEKNENCMFNGDCSNDLKNDNCIKNNKNLTTNVDIEKNKNCKINEINCKNLTTNLDKEKNNIYIENYKNNSPIIFPKKRYTEYEFTKNKKINFNKKIDDLTEVEYCKVKFIENEQTKEKQKRNVIVINKKIEGNTRIEDKKLDNKRIVDNECKLCEDNTKIEDNKCKLSEDNKFKLIEGNTKIINNKCILCEDVTHLNKKIKSIITENNNNFLDSIDENTLFKLNRSIFNKEFRKDIDNKKEQVDNEYFESNKEQVDNEDFYNESIYNEDLFNKEQVEKKDLHNKSTDIKQQVDITTSNINSIDIKPSNNNLTYIKYNEPLNIQNHTLNHKISTINDTLFNSNPIYLLKQKNNINYATVTL